MLTSNINARIVQSVTQPIGTLVRTYETSGPLPFAVQPPPPVHQPYPLPTTPIGEVNYICAQWDSEETTETAPFDTHYSASEIILTEQQHFVRLLCDTTSSSNGAWIMRSEYVRGKTPEELADIFALRNPPIEIVNVEMPASPDSAGKNYALWTGIAGPIRGAGHDWGDGGAVQNRLVADYGTNYFPTYRFTTSATRNHRQPIGAYALSYKPMANCGNPYCIASYLDSYIPQAYSDLENVYHFLDYINYIDYGPLPLNCALHQVSPERYDAVSFVAFRNSVLFEESIFEEQINNHWANRWDSCDDEKYQNKPSGGLQSINEFNYCVPVYSEGLPAGACDNFRYKTNGALLRIDWNVHPHITLGVSAGGFGNRLHWCDNCGVMNSGTAKAGLYVSYFPQNFFIDGMISGGGNWASICRYINFYGVSRQAQSHPRFTNIEVHLQGGVTKWQWITPSARLSYFFNHQKCFREWGADSLNLDVHTYNTHTLRARVGIDMKHLFVGKNSTFVPQIQIAWAQDFFLRKHIIKAQLCGLTNCLAVRGMNQFGGYFICGTELNFLLKNCSALFARYDAQIRSKFIAHTVKLGVEARF